MKIILDASAWIEYFKDTPLALKIEKYIQQDDCYTLCITMAEVVSKLIRDNVAPDKGIEAMRHLSKVLSDDESLALQAAHLHVQRRLTHPKFSFADAFVAALAKRIHGKVLTKDNDFSGMSEAIILKGE